MATKLTAFAFGGGIGWLLAWARVTDPAVIQNMLLLREPDVFLLMGSAVTVAAVGARILRHGGAKALVTKEPIAWTTERPQMRHVAGSLLFGAGWSVAGTCPGPVAAMVGQGQLGGLVVMAGLVTGLSLQRLLSSRRGTAAGPQSAGATECV